jgi:hypothetical protein
MPASWGFVLKRCQARKRTVDRWIGPAMSMMLAALLGQRRRIVGRRLDAERIGGHAGH